MSRQFARRLPLRTMCRPALALVLLALALFRGAGAPVFASPAGSVQVQQVTQQDRDGDGQPDLTIIDCSFVTQNDQVRVYDGAGDMRPGSDWEQVTDFTNDTWIFDVGADGSAQLIIRFSQQDNRTIANLFSDQTNDGEVSYEVREQGIFVREEPLRPPLTVSVEGDWLLPNGNLNWNLLFQADGGSVQFRAKMPDEILSTLRLNSEPDVEMEFKDEDNDGIPEYGLVRLLAPSRLNQSFPRTLLWVNSGENRPAPANGFIFWPLLDGTPSGSNYFDSYPIIEVDWATARVPWARLPGYPIEHGYHVNTLQYFTKGEINYADFENPMAYYDLANDQDGLPELHIRIVHQDAGDTFRENLPVPVNDVRWSWNQRNGNGLIWDYKLGLAGRHAITETVEFPDFTVMTVPHAELPTWVTSRAWDYATFVAREGARDLSSEGIYHWPAVEALGHTGLAYLAGRAVVDIESAFQKLSIGWRGDFAPDLNQQPYVYISAVDRKLHLYRASHGVWKTDESSELRYANLDGDPYLDQWTYTQVITGTQVTTFTKQLNVARSHALYSDGRELVLRQATIAPSLFETLPPTNHAEWEILGAELQAAELDIAPDDFEAMLEQFAGPETRITGAGLRDYRPVGAEGFRFVLSLQPGFALQGSDLLGVRGLEPGNYAVTYDGDFSIEPLRLPVLSASIQDTTLTQLEQGAMYVTLRNDGLQDVPRATLELWASPPQGEAKIAVTDTISLLAQEPVTTTLYWAPPTPGEWTVTPKIRRADGLVTTLDSQSVTVLPTRVSDSRAMVAESTSPVTLIFTVIGLVTFAGVAGLIFWREWRKLAMDQVDDTA